MKVRYLRAAHLVMVVCLFVLATAAMGASVLEEGRAAYAAGDYKTAIEKWQALIDDGQPEGQFFLGVMYAEGKGVEQDHARAFQLYSEAAEKDYVPAQYNLGNQYATGEGVALDFSKAEYRWSNAAERGLMRAQINLGHLYYFGLTGEKNPVLARKWLTLAADQGSPDAKDVLAKLDAEMPQTPSPPEQPAASDAPQPASPQPATPPRAATDALRREAWVLAQPSSHYTIQISALGADTLVREYIKQHDLSATAAYIETLSQGNTVFRIIYGSYARRELADKALASLPRAISANAPWVRPFADLHKLVDRRYAERGAP